MFPLRTVGVKRTLIILEPNRVHFNEIHNTKRSFISKYTWWYFTKIAKRIYSHIFPLRQESIPSCGGGGGGWPMVSEKNKGLTKF